MTGSVTPGSVTAGCDCLNVTQKFCQFLMIICFEILSVFYCFYRGGENAVACRLVVQHVHTQLTNRGFQLRQQLRSCHAGQPLPSNFFQLESTPQIKGMAFRNRSWNCSSFRAPLGIMLGCIDFKLSEH